MEHKELTKKIIGCAYKVYNQMGFGFLEFSIREMPAHGTQQGRIACGGTTDWPDY